MPTKSVPAFLVMNTGASAGARFELLPDQSNPMGRDWECRIVLNDPQCSRIHAVLYRDEDGWWIRDNNSSNGTFVNGQTVDQARLVDGTQVRVGNSVFSFTEKIRGAAGDLPESADTSAFLDRQKTGGLTVVADKSLDPLDTGQYTLDFLKGHNWGKDFFFLFQLSVKLLSVSDPETVVETSMQRLFERTEATVAGFLWLSDAGDLTPKQVFPADQRDKLQLSAELTRRVVKQKSAIRVEHETNEDWADSICVPLIQDNEVSGAIHLYRDSQAFHGSHFQLACATANIIQRALANANRLASLKVQHSRLMQKSAAFDELQGGSDAMLELKSRISRVAKASGCVLVRGESGSGKELVARAIHRASPRADRPMLSVNCAAIPRELMESQLFGHKKGSFTSADRDHIGWFQQADLGTLFLDEIGELTLEGQAKLLRTLEGHPFLPVGGTEEVQVDVRVICATNRDLKEFVQAKQFREDLYYRLSVYELFIPPLREREGDLQLLIDFFLDHFRNQHGKPAIGLSRQANNRLLSYQWPGNVRQLRNVIDSAIVMAEGDEIQLDDLGIRDPGTGELETLRIDHWEQKLIRDALKRTRNSVPKAAELLGISRATLYRKIEEYGIER